MQHSLQGTICLVLSFFLLISRLTAVCNETLLVRVTGFPPRALVVGTTTTHLNRGSTLKKYCESQLSNILFKGLLQDRALKSADRDVLIYVAHLCLALYYKWHLL